MIEVHHLNNSRSQRVLWLLEELGLPYEIVAYQRDAADQPGARVTPGDPPARQVAGDPGRRDQVLIESGAILEYIVRKYGKGKLAPAESSPDWPRYLQFIHYAEGSAMLPRDAEAVLSRLGEAGAPLAPRVTSEIENHFGYLDGELAGADWFVGKELERRRHQSVVPDPGRAAAARARQVPEPGALPRARARAPGVQARARARRPVPVRELDCPKLGPPTSVSLCAWPAAR